MYEYGINKLPTFAANSLMSATKKIIQETQWEVRQNRVLAVKGANIILLYGDESEADRLNFYAQVHNMNILLGISDEEYNLSIGSP